MKTAVECLLEAEKHFTQLTNDIDEKLNSQEDKSTTNGPAQTVETLSKDCTLIAIPSGQPTMLEAKYTLFVLLCLFG